MVPVHFLNLDFKTVLSLKTTRVGFHPDIIVFTHYLKLIPTSE